jgi:FtsP/CotA-like multicopper oxidase with cupredoxin domain
VIARLPTRASLVGTAAMTVVLVFGGCGAPPPPSTPQSVPDLPTAVLNDLRTKAGRMEGGTLVVALDIVDAAWTPRGADGPRVAIRAIAESGQAPMVPAPLIRVPAGTPVRLTIRNKRSEPEQFGIGSGPGQALNDDVLDIPPGESREWSWTPTAPVTSVYGLNAIDGPAGASLGPVVVDPAGASPPDNERILLLSSWGSSSEPTSLDTAYSWKMLVNGRSWPHTERLEATVGQAQHWRVINASPEWHPMHLHGFYFRVTATGDFRADAQTDLATSPEVVTHTLAPSTSMALTWTPREPGNWLFHCHLLRHSGPTQRFVGDASHSGMAMDDGMSGMIVGITVHEGVEARISDPAPARQIKLWTAAQPGGHGAAPRLAFVEQQGESAPAPDVAPTLSSLLVLERDQPVAITVHNRLEAPLAVHWHGLELKSQYDGVGHWSGMPGMPRAPIPPGDTTVVHLQPPRAGTFIYHTHGEEGHELPQGLYGPLVVMPPGETYNRERDRIFVLSASGANRDADPAVNGLREPPAETFEAGQTYRLRFIQIAADEAKLVGLRKDGEPVRWRAIAKDGADLAEPLRVTGPAQFRADVGETYDFEWSPASSGVYQLVVQTISYPIDFARGPTQTIAFAVGAVAEGDVTRAHEGFDSVLSLTAIQRLVMAAAGVIVLVVVAMTWWLVRWFLRRRRRLSAA